MPERPIQTDGEHADVEAIYDALDADAPERALQIALDSLAADGAGDPVLDFLAGVALYELDRNREAVVHLRRAVEADPDDSEFGCQLALSLFLCAAFDESRQVLDRARAGDATLPDLHVVEGLLAEVDGDYAAADAAFARAHRLDDSLRAPRWLGADAFSAAVRTAGERLPERFRRYLDEIDVTVDPTPGRSLILAEHPPLDPTLLGLFVGTPLPDQITMSPGGELPPRIFLFQRNLERYATGEQDLVEQIAITLYHELGHYLGLEEDELEAIDLA